MTLRMLSGALEGRSIRVNAWSRSLSRGIDIIEISSGLVSDCTKPTILCLDIWQFGTVYFGRFQVGTLVIEDGCASGTQQHRTFRFQLHREAPLRSRANCCPAGSFLVGSMLDHCLKPFGIDVRSLISRSSELVGPKENGQCLSEESRSSQTRSQSRAAAFSMKIHRDIVKSPIVEGCYSLALPKTRKQFSENYRR